MGIESTTRSAHAGPVLGRVRRWIRLALVVAVATVCTSVGTSTAHAADNTTITRTSWDMLITPAPHGEVAGVDPATRNQQAYFDAVAAAAVVPAGTWLPAPDANEIGFDGRKDIAGYVADQAKTKRPLTASEVDALTAATQYPCKEGEVSPNPRWTATGDTQRCATDGKSRQKLALGGRTASRLANLPNTDCGKRFDFTYFRTTVNLPKGASKDKLDLEFRNSDDFVAVRVNDSKPIAFKPSVGGSSRSGDLRPLLNEGPNTITVVQIDDCAIGNIFSKVTVHQGNGSSDKQIAPEPRVIGPADRGDVHIKTPDGLAYDFQAVGDFLLLRDSTDSVVVHARQQPWKTKPSASINTAIGLSVAGDKLEFYLLPEKRLFVNDVLTDLPTAPLTLPHGGTVTPQAGKQDYTILWPDGNTGARVVLQPSFLDVGVARLQGSLTYEGLLGNLDRNAKNDMQVRGGDQIQAPASAAQLTTFGDSWRIEANKTLFDDPAPADPGVPAATLAALDPDTRSKAATTCQDGGVTDSLARDNCTLDVATTGDPAFVASAMTYQQAVAAVPESERAATVLAVQPTAGDSTDSAAPNGLLANPLVWVGVGAVLVVLVIGATVAVRRGRRT